MVVVPGWQKAGPVQNWYLPMTTRSADPGTLDIVASSHSFQNVHIRIYTPPFYTLFSKVYSLTSKNSNNPIILILNFFML